MPDAQDRAEKRFAAILNALSNATGVTHTKSGSRPFGSVSLKVHDKIFAKASSNGGFVVSDRRRGWTTSSQAVRVRG